MICPNCGNEIPDNAVFCPRCGGKITSAQEGQNTPSIVQADAKSNTEPAPKNRTLVAGILVLVTAVLLLVLIIGVPKILLNNMSSKYQRANISKDVEDSHTEESDDSSIAALIESKKNEAVGGSGSESDHADINTDFFGKDKQDTVDSVIQDKFDTVDPAEQDRQDAVDSVTQDKEDTGDPADQDKPGTSDSADQNKQYTADEIGELAYRYYKAKYGSSLSFFVEDNGDGTVSVQLFEDGADATATLDWYTIDVKTLKGTSLFGEEIDLNGF